MQRTEPMTIGSPVSPSGRQQNPFLPAFLMGDSPYSAPLTPNSKAWGLHSSPGCSSLNRSSANQNSTNALNSSRNDRLPIDDVPAKSPGRKRIGGPPVKGLFEILPPTCGTLPFKLDTNDSHLTSAGRSLQVAAALNDHQQFNHGSGAVSPNCDCGSTDKMRRASSLSHLASPHDSHSFQGESAYPEESVDVTWVTIFGFPTTTESFILQEFSSFGTIVRHLVPPEGNWMHVQFQNQRQARKALSRHSKVLPGNIMIGVKPCGDKLKPFCLNHLHATLAKLQKNNEVVLELNKENSGLSMKPTCMHSPATTVVNTGFQDLHQPTMKLSSIRPLASGTQAQPSPARVQRKNSIVSNVMSYVFGR